MTRFAPYLIVFTLFSLICTPAKAKDVRYVSDDLTIPMRTGTTTNHKILKFLNSGMAVEILEENPERTHARVKLIEDDSKVGWVEMRLLMTEPSARIQLEELKKTNQIIRRKRDEINQQLKDARAGAEVLKKQLVDQSRQLQSVEQTLSTLRTSAAEPIRLAEENQSLSQALAEEKARNAALVEQNAILADQNIKQWFMIGAAVSLGSLILGLLITRINWKKRDSWGGSF